VLGAAIRRIAVENKNAEIQREITRFQLSLRTLDRSLRRLAPMLSATVSMNSPAEDNGRSRSRFSAKGRAALVLQGRYVGYMRQLKPGRKGQVRKIRKARCVKMAIVRAKELTLRES
jgi:hypothetical protein